MRNEDYTAMTVPVAGQAGGNATRARVHVQEYSGDHTLRTFSMDQKAKGSFDNGLQNRHLPILAWQQGVEDGSASSVESSRVGDMTYPAPDASLPMFQKLRGGGLHISDPSGFSEDEDAPDMIQDGSPLAHAKRRMHVSHHLAHTSAASNMDDGEFEMRNFSFVCDSTSECISSYYPYWVCSSLRQSSFFACLSEYQISPFRAGDFAAVYNAVD